MKSWENYATSFDAGLTNRTVADTIINTVN